MIIVYDKDQKSYVIRPCPFVNITWNSNVTTKGVRGGKYDIVLTGTIINDAGSPIFRYDKRQDPSNGSVWQSTYYPRPAELFVSDSGALGAILSKQILIRELFAKRCAYIEIGSIDTADTPIIGCYPTLVSVNFADDIWTKKCDYTINLEAAFLFDKGGYIIGADNYSSDNFKPGSAGWAVDSYGRSIITLDQFINNGGGIIEDIQESWSLEPEEGNGNTWDPYPVAPQAYETVTRIYRLTRNITAKGAKLTNEAGCGIGNIPASELSPHAQAKKYVLNMISPKAPNGIPSNTLSGYDKYPDLEQSFGFASGILNLSPTGGYACYNHSRTENIDVTAGSYTLQDTWILSQDRAYENYTLSLSTSEGDSLITVSIDGTIKGLTSLPAYGPEFGGRQENKGTFNTSYENAINKYRQITNFGEFGITAWTFKRAQNAAGGFTLNPKPASITVGTNEFTGEITYNLQYDNRATNAIGGAKFENVSVTDTYPGDVFAIIPVIGRSTGPILQYIGTRTEYQRSLSLELIVDKSTPSGTNNRQTLLTKPSLRTGPGGIGGMAGDIKNLINAYSPGLEPGIRKYFVSPPQETWDPKEGRYNLSINWTYELDH